MTFFREIVDTRQAVYIFWMLKRRITPLYFPAVCKSILVADMVHTFLSLSYWERQTINCEQGRPFCTRCCRSLQSETVWKEKQHRCQRTSSIHELQWRQNVMQRQLISILYNLIHGFTDADESMTDIQ